MNAIENTHLSGPTQLDRHIGGKLRELRTWRKLSQGDLGAKFDLTYQQIGKYEDGKNRIPSATLYLFAKALGIKPEWFYEGLDDVAEQERPPKLDAQQRRLIAAFDRITDRGIRNGLAAFIHALADGMAIEMKGGAS